MVRRKHVKKFLQLIYSICNNLCDENTSVQQQKARRKLNVLNTLQQENTENSENITIDEKEEAFILTQVENYLT